jgi:hypothetical protein
VYVILNSSIVIPPRLFFVAPISRTELIDPRLKLSPIARRQHHMDGQLLARTSTAWGESLVRLGFRIARPMRSHQTRRYPTGAEGG